MSCASYIALKRRLAEIGEFYSTRPPTHKFNDDDDYHDMLQLADEAAVLLGLHSECASCGGRGREPLDYAEVSAQCRYCNGTGTQSAGSDTPGIDRIAIANIGPIKVDGQILIEGDPGPVIREHYILPSVPCETCAPIQCVVCKRRKKPIGRDASGQENLCNSWDCVGYMEEPQPRSYWPSDPDCPDCSGTGQWYWKYHQPGDWDDEVRDIDSPGERGLRVYGPFAMGGYAFTGLFDYPAGNHPPSDDPIPWSIMWQRVCIRDAGRLDRPLTAKEMAHIMKVNEEARALIRRAEAYAANQQSSEAR